MPGGLIQLAAYGAQDYYLTGNPQISFFKTVYRRYTNFSMECIKQTINGDNYFVEPLKLEIRRFIDILKGEDLYYPDTTLTNDIQKIIDDIGKYT